MTAADIYANKKGENKTNHLLPTPLNMIKTIRIYENESDMVLGIS